MLPSGVPGTSHVDALAAMGSSQAVLEGASIMASQLNITHLSHDLASGKSYLSFVLADDPNKRLGLEVPFGTAIADAEAAGRAALTALSRELDAAELVVQPSAGT
jgi:hypothetical protein